MFKYAQIDNGVIVGLQEAHKEIIANNLVLLTNEIVGLGDTYSNGVFAPKIPTSPPPIRTITKRSFMQRFTQAERIAIRNSIEDIKLDRINQNVPNVARNHIDDVLIDVVADLDVASEKYGVDLDLQATIDGLTHFVTMSILTANRLSELLVDGTDNESV